MEAATLESFNGKEFTGLDGKKYVGHPYDLHVGKNEEFLRSRKIPNASSFPDAQTAEMVYQEILRHNRARIKSWISDSNSDAIRSFRHTFIDAVGYGLRETEDFATVRHGATIVLVKTSSGIDILTAYPIE